MSENEKETQKVELEEAQVLDPRDYNQNKRIKEIHRAKSDFIDAYSSDPQEYEGYMDKFARRDIVTAESLGVYVANIEPVLREVGILDSFLKEKVESAKKAEKLEIGELYENNFMIMHEGDVEALSRVSMMSVFRTSNEYLNKVGLGLEIEEKEEGLKL